MFCFNKNHKLTKSIEFEKVFANHKQFNTNYLRINYVHNQLDRPRLGLIISKKNHKKANKRNYMKRILRELFRKQQLSLPNIDIIIRLKWYFTRNNFHEVNYEFEKFVKRINKA